MIKKVKGVNPSKIQPTPLPLGIEVSAGDGLSLAWIATGLLVASSIPLTIEYVLF